KENPIPTPLVFPEEAPGECKKPSIADKCKVSKEMSGVDVAYGSDENRRCTMLYNSKVFQQKQQPASGGPLKHPDIEQSSTSMKVENRDSDTAISNNVSANHPEISPGAVEKSFHTSFVSPEKATGDYKKSLLEDEHDKSIKMSEVNVVHGSGGNKRSVRLHNVKLS
ncbi:SANTA (SANT associated) protein, partial [Trifolium medium]|nr:SANTA (SANT associated) protein [Trifolium medium]